MSRAQDKKHSQALDEIINNCQHLFGIDHVDWTQKEMRFYNGPNIYCEPDGMAGYWVKNGQGILVFEYKGSNAHKDYAIIQLERAEDRIKQTFNPREIQQWYVWGSSFNRERIR